MVLNLDWEIRVERPVDAVFDAFIADMWHVMSGGSTTSVRALTDGPLAAGSVYVHLAEHRSGRRVESKIAVDAYEPNNHVELSWSSGEAGRWISLFAAAGFANFWYSPAWGEEGSRLEARFLEEDGGTRLRASTRHQLTGALVPLSFIMRWPAHRRIKRRLLRFKEAVEASGATTTSG